MAQPHEVTAILERMATGDAEAAERLFPLVYDELRALAGAMFRDERVGHTLQPTALVHDAYVRLAGGAGAGATGGAGAPQTRAHFMALAAKVMRQLLIDHARARRAAKRGGGAVNVASGRGSDAADERTLMTLDQTPAPDGVSSADVLDLDEAVVALSAQYPRAARVVELKFFGGLTAQEIATVLGVGDATVERDWALARGWLARRLTGERA